ncbi:serine/threonine-protein kinase [Mycobacterium antarcticum]|uniref:serine/threonine-protein kinase n=1 Tax=unclassified Mycolicibacterium TaxID=2636767 RepID=UPI0024E042DA|nr:MULTISPECIES: serine/threonine-protein kinase [unclassified Mycolicibacterium]
MAARELIGGRYEIRGVLGRGGMATVYDGWDTRLQRPVAVKLLHPAFSADPECRARIEFEARSAAALNHPNIVVVHDGGHDAQRGGTPYLIMERLPGRTLLDLIARGALSPQYVRGVLGDVLAGLSVAHAAGILHRDVKPANIVLGAAGEAKIADFGIAKSGDTDLTSVGQMVGTMAYLSPERIAGQPATPLDDLYAVGAVGYEALTGRMPFPQPDPASLMRAIVEHQLPPLTAVRPDIDPHLAGVIDRAMAPDPRHRFPDADTMRAALQSVRPPTLILPAPLAGAVAPMSGVMVPPPPGRRRKVLAGLAIGAALILGLVLVIAEVTTSRPATSETPLTTPPTSVSTSVVAPPTTTPTLTLAPVPQERPGNGPGGGPKKPKPERGE